MTLEERNLIVDIINFFWGEGIAKPSQVNERVVFLVHDALVEADKCTASMRLVPRPPMAKPGLRYVVQQLKKVAKRISEESADVYQTCRQRVRVNYLSQLRLALMGL